MVTAPTVYSIAPNWDFVDSLARGLMDRFGETPEGLSPVLILLPTRRGCRTLREAFLRLSGGAPLLLPRMRPIGDIDEEDLALAGGVDVSVDSQGLFDAPPAMPEMKRQLLLAKLIMKRDRDTSAEQAVLLARALGHLLDQAQTERLRFDKLETLAPAELSVHWQESLKFLEIVTAVWPSVLTENGSVDPAMHRNLLLDRQRQLWERSPPDHPVIAAGSTGSIPATADLLATVARLPQGSVVLPGLDRYLDDGTWAAVREDEAHPQFGLARLLNRLDLSRDAVEDWPAAEEHRSAPEIRVSLAAEALRPARTTDAWAKKPLKSALLMEALDNHVQIMTCRDPGDEARTISLLFREVLDDEGMTAALVTPDRELGRRVAAEMQRWGVTVDDSAGTPLSATPPAAFLLLLSTAIAEHLAPTALLSLLKHPLCAAGQVDKETRRQARALERAILRGPRPAGGIAGLRRSLDQARTDKHGPAPAILRDADSLVDLLAPILSPLEAQDSATIPEFIRLLSSVGEALAATPDDPDGRRLWAGDNGEALAGFIDELDQTGGILDSVPMAELASLIPTMMAGRVVRPRYGAHPRLAIYGPLEARLHHADLMVLGGLNEGTWPSEPPVDPWMSRPMRKQFGLPSPERRIGLSAHDFAQAFCAPRVVITRSAKADGSPTVPSRWLQRLETLLQGGMEKEALAKWRRQNDLFAALASRLDQPARIQTCKRPAPAPPVEARPDHLSVTQIEKWLRDPYTIFARYILRLEPLDDIDADPGALDRGIIIHDVFEQFIRQHAGRPLPPNAVAELKKLGLEHFKRLDHSPGVSAIWWPRFERAAEAFVRTEADRRDQLQQSHVEISGKVELSSPNGTFTLTGKADRIDLFKDGSVEILDYKTGAPPTKTNVDTGFNPQLALEGMILRLGGFKGIPPSAPVENLTYWQVSGGKVPLKVIDAGTEPAGDLIDAAEEGLRELIRDYADAKKPYVARPASAYALAFNDYEHLARIREWAVTEAAS